MILKVEMNETIKKFLEKEPIYNLNILGVIENVPTVEIYVDNIENPKGVLVRKEYFNYIYTTEDSFIDEVLEELFKEGFYGFSGVERSIAEKIRSRYQLGWESRCALHYLPEENLDLTLIKNPVSDIKLEDAEVVDKYYTYRHPGSLEIIRNDIKNRPSSAVYVNEEIACWVLIHDDDSMGIMYTKEEYRKKGYAADVSVDLTSKIFKNGKVPFLQIVQGNSMSPGLANKCGFVQHGYSDWFGIIAGVPKEIRDLSNLSGEIFEKSLSEELKKSFKFKSFTENHMFYSIYDLIKNNNLDTEVSVNEASSKESIEKCCEIIAQCYCSKEENIESFKEEFLNSVMKKDSPLQLYLGDLNGQPASATAILKVEEDVCGIYFTSTLPTFRNKGIGKATAIEALKLEGKKNMELAFLQTSEGMMEFYKKLGFSPIT
jgi:predicted GNAT family acetyltransferase